MLPQFFRQTPPQYRPQQYAGLGARANAGIGQATAGLGTAVAGGAEKRAERGDVLAASRAWRQLDEWRIGYLRELPQRRAELAAMATDETTGSSVAGYDKELDSFPDSLKAKFEELSENLSGGARAKLELAYNAAAPKWSAEAVTALDGMELEGIVAEARDLAKSGRSADALELADLYRDRLGPENHQQLAVELAMTGARADLQAIAASDGWQKAREALQDPLWQEMYGLDVAEAADVRNALAGFVNEEAAMADAKRRAAVEKTSDQFLLQAEGGSADLDAGRQLVAEGLLPFEVFEQGKKLQMAPPDRTDDPGVFMQSEAWISRVRQDPSKKAEALQWLRSVASQLSETSWKSAVSTVERAGDPVDVASSPNVTLYEKLLDEHFRDLGTFGDPSTAEGERGYIDAITRFRAYLKDNPQATEEQIRAQYDGLTKRPAQVSLMRKIYDSWPADILLPKAPKRTWRMGPAGMAKYGYTLADIEPQSRQEFEDTVKTFPPGSDEQAAYYERWASKWQ